MRSTATTLVLVLPTSTPQATAARVLLRTSPPVNERLTGLDPGGAQLSRSGGNRRQRRLMDLGDVPESLHRGVTLGDDLRLYLVLRQLVGRDGPGWK